MQNANTHKPVNTDPSDKSDIFKTVAMILLPLLIIIGFIAATIITIKANKKPKERQRTFNTLAVLADYAVRDNVQLSISTQGEARPQTEIDFVPQVGGKIVYVSPNFIEGGIFKKGEVLIRLEDADYQVAVIRAEANVAQAQQALVREVAEGDIARQDYAELGGGNASSLALREPQRKQAEASLQASMAELEGAKLQLTRTEIRAPFSGRVRTKNSDLGQFVGPGFQLGRIFSTDIVEVRLPLTDDNLSKINLPIAYVAPSRQTAPRVSLSAIIAGQEQVWEGRIMRTDPVYDTQTRALFAIAEVFDPYGKGVSNNGVPLAPGLFVDARLEGKTFDNVVILPRDGLRPENEVYVVDDKGKVDVRKAEVLDTDASRAVLRSGVEAGELIVLSPLSKNRISIPLKALDINNPETVLVDPPKPDWQKALEAKDKAADKPQKKKRRWGKKPQKGDEKAPKKPLKKSDNPSEEKDDTTTDPSEARAVNKTDDAPQGDQK